MFYRAGQYIAVNIALCDFRRHGHICRRHRKFVPVATIRNHFNCTVIYFQCRDINPDIHDAKQDVFTGKSLCFAKTNRNKSADAIVNRDGAVNLGIFFRYLRGVARVAEVFAAHGALPILDVHVRSLVVFARVGNNRGYDIRLGKFRRARIVGEILAVTVAAVAILLDTCCHTGCGFDSKMRVSRQ